MPRPIRRRTLLHAALALGSGLPAILIAPSARACEFFASSLRITHPWTRATPIGERTAKICMRFDEVTRSDRLIGVETPVAAGADMGDTAGAVEIPIPEGQTTELTEAGIHVRLTGLKHPLELGRTYPLTLRFAHGGEVAASFDVDYEAFADGGSVGRFA